MPSKEKKSTRIVVKCTQDSKVNFNEKFKALGFKNGADYIRYSLNNQNIVVLDSSKITSQLFKISEELHRVGSNLNQLSRAYHDNGELNSEQLSLILNEYDSLTKQLNQSFKQANKLYKDALNKKGGGTDVS